MQKRLIDEKTFWEYRFVSAPGFSPDGEAIAYVVTTVDGEENAYRNDLYLWEGGRARRLTAGGDAGSYCWTPEGTLLFPAARDPKCKEAAEKGEPLTVWYEIDPRGGEAREAFRVHRAAGGLKPLSGSVYAFAAEERIGEKPEKDDPCDVLDELPFWQNGGSFASRTRQALFLYDRKSGRETRLTSENECLMGYSDACAGKLLLIAREHPGVRPLCGDLWECDIASGERRALLSGDDFRVFSAFYLDGAPVVYGTKAEKYGMNESGSFFRLDASGKPVLLAEEALGVGDGYINSDARMVGGFCERQSPCAYRYLTINRFRSELRELAPDGSIRTLYAPGCDVDSFDAFGGHIASCEMRGDELAEIYLDGVRITRENDALTRSLRLSTPEYFPFESGGATLDGWIMKPVGFDPSKRYPAILHIHGGPRTAFGECFHNEQQLWAAKGYFVFFCNPRGSDGRGDAFADIWGKYGAVDYDDLMAFTDACLARCPQVDPSRVGVTGGSYGGYMTNWIIGHTDRFRCAVSQRSIANWISFEHTSDIGYFFTEAQHNAVTAENPEVLWDASPLKYARNALTPTLFIHSDHDYRCWMAEGLQMFTALKMRGVETRLCLFRGETHELSRSGKPKSRERRMQEIVRWMDRFLQPEADVAEQGV